MMEDDMKRNGIGYYDETPVKTCLFSNGPQDGEIWESTLGKEFLALKNHGGYCNTLLLRDHTSHADNIEVISREVRYVNPVMIGYLANRDLSCYIKTIPQEKYLEIMEAVGERMGVTIKVSRAEEKDLTTQADREAYDDAIKSLEAQRDELLAELKDRKEKQIMSCEMIKNERESKEIAQAAADGMRAAYQLAEEKATLYEKMYTALLDRIFARGEAK